MVQRAPSSGTSLPAWQPPGISCRQTTVCMIALPSPSAIVIRHGLPSCAALLSRSSWAGTLSGTALARALAACLLTRKRPGEDAFGLPCKVGHKAHTSSCSLFSWISALLPWVLAPVPNLFRFWACLTGPPLPRQVSGECGRAPLAGAAHSQRRLLCHRQPGALPGADQPACRASSQPGGQSSHGIRDRASA